MDVANMAATTLVWKKLHRLNGYFTKHACYTGAKYLAPDGIELASFWFGLPNKMMRVLDLGCGYGRLMYYLAPLVGETVGMDIAEEPLAEARRLLEETRSSYEWELAVGDGQTLPFPDNHFHGVISVSVFQHIPRAVAAGYMREIKRVLKPGGRVVVQLLGGRRSDRDIDPKEACETSVQYSDEQARILASDAGLLIISVEKTRVNTRPALQLACVVLVATKEDK